ncbi:hypothetical protein [Streptomyces sp. NPDC059009]|uniref:hypothetical protein n=1 Tax=Streptomyces sp. NPDC059009 TaxID=3346694 RepID=UPI003696820C
MNIASIRNAGIKHRIAGVAVAGAAVLAVGGATTVSAQAQSSASTSASAESSSAAAYRCPSGAICVHGYKVVNGHKKYSWASPKYSCVNHGPWKKWMPTSYINNQTHGTVAKFKDVDKRTIQKSKPASSSGPVKGKVKYPGRTFYVKPC